MVKSKFIPMRFCVSCRKKFEKSSLIRVVKTKDKEVKVDEFQKIDGRGVYFCNDENCFKILKKKRGLEKNLKCSISQQIYDELEEILNLK